MSTPGTGNTDGDRHGARRVDGPDNPTELIDTGRSGSGASPAGRADSTPATGHGTGATRADAGGNDYVPGGYSSEDDTSGDYVPGMYSDDADSTATRAYTPAPISASRDASSRDENATPQTQVVPVTAARRPSESTDDGSRDRGMPRGTATASGLPSLEDRKLLHRREKEHFGAMRFGSAFFGWLTATGMFVLLSALVGSLAALFGIGADLSTADLTGGSGAAQTAGITAAVALGVILLLSYFAGGYVAGRMARFSGVKQGVAVWLWAIVAAVVLAVIGFVVGNQANITDRFQTLGVPSAQEFTVPGLIGLFVVAAVALLGAILGGLAGMRYHRKIDRADFDALDEAG